MLFGNHHQRPFELSPLPIAMVIVVDPSQEPIPTSMARTENPPAGTPVSTGECRDRSLTDRTAGTNAGTVEVNLDPMYGEQAEALLWNSAVRRSRTVTPQLYMRFPLSVPLCTRDVMSVNSSHTVSPKPMISVIIWKRPLGK